MSNPDQFYENLGKVAYEALSDATKRIRELNSENERLSGIIAAFPSTATDLQDRVSLLEKENADMQHDITRLLNSLSAEVNKP